MPMALPMFFTRTGCGWSLVLLSPSCPELSLPQQLTVPSADKAHVCSLPIASAVTLARPLTATGCDCGTVDPSPNWPLPFAPQHRTVPSSSKAQECEAL